MYSMKNLAKTGYIICLFLILALFCYFRVKPVYFQTVPYTFDQGRDFLKTQEIVIDKQPALLGPTTGIPGGQHRRLERPPVRETDLPRMRARRLHGVEMIRGVFRALPAGQEYDPGDRRRH